jgi:hypothetical protein
MTRRHLWGWGFAFAFLALSAVAGIVWVVLEAMQ